eukprot:TRINITY_DN3321_c0_g1_i1.p1 TRINITY_DN3321_c0_g1~~TRINITY_DN3321_c0_g1_i1.p1  ORF type:complete len:367 (+),score=89.86 TRINITY_DN3321_c0_g1_i1:136-1236(+)
MATETHTLRIWLDRQIRASIGLCTMIRDDIIALNQLSDVDLQVMFAEFPKFAKMYADCDDMQVIIEYNAGKFMRSKSTVVLKAFMPADAFIAIMARLEVQLPPDQKEFLERRYQQTSEKRATQLRKLERSIPLEGNFGTWRISAPPAILGPGQAFLKCECSSEEVPVSTAVRSLDNAVRAMFARAGCSDIGFRVWHDVDPQTNRYRALVELAAEHAEDILMAHQWEGEFHASATARADEDESQDRKYWPDQEQEGFSNLLVGSFHEYAQRVSPQCVIVDDDPLQARARWRQPKQAAAPPAGPVLQGVVDKWNAEKGFGFVKQVGQRIGVFCHISQVSGGSMAVGVRVSFQIGQGPKGPQAVRVCVM